MIFQDCRICSDLKISCLPSYHPRAKMMTFFLQTFLLACFVATIQTKIYGRCELAHVLKKNGMDGYEGYSLASWICMAFYETGFDTSTIDRHKGGTKDYGIFHINSGLWCKENNALSKAICDIACSDLLNPDLEDDINCAKMIVQDSTGMAAWQQWKKHCENQDMKKWVKGCKV